LRRKPPERLIELGRIAGTFGVRGWVKVDPEGAETDALTGTTEWTIGAEVFGVEEAKVHGAIVVAKLAGIGTREQALELKGKNVAVPRAALPQAAEGHYYLADLAGLEVVNAQGARLGVVKRVFWSGAHDVMEVANGKSRLIPWVPAVVKEVDLEKRRIDVDWGADW
jgi:16S rRNA processing protein RimM